MLALPTFTGKHSIYFNHVPALFNAAISNKKENGRQKLIRHPLCSL
jgi:hypothetical protein